MADDVVISEFEARRVQRLLRSLYSGRLRADEQVAVSGWRRGDWLEVRWELADDARRFVYPVEVRVDLRASRLRQAPAIDLLYDFLGERMGEFLLDRFEPFSGPEWEAVEFGGHVIHLRGQVMGEAQEAAANALLDEDARRRSAVIAVPAKMTEDVG